MAFYLSSSARFNGQRADEETLEEIKQMLVSTPGVQGVHDLKTRRSGDYLLVDVHLEIKGDLTVSESHEIVVNARNKVLQNKQILGVGCGASLKQFDSIIKSVGFITFFVPQSANYRL